MSLGVFFIALYYSVFTSFKKLDGRNRSLPCKWLWVENLIIVLCQHNGAFKSSQFPLQPGEVLWWKALCKPLKLCPLMFHKCLQPQWLFLSTARIAAASSFYNSNQWLQQQRTFASLWRHSQQLVLVGTLHFSLVKFRVCKYNQFYQQRSEVTCPWLSYELSTEISLWLDWELPQLLEYTDIFESLH